MTHVTNNSGNNEWYTPHVYVEAARRVLKVIDTDPASNTTAQQYIQAETFWTKENSALDKHWRGSVWMNPPYDKSIHSFIDKLIYEVKEGRVNSFITLTNNATETKWFKKLAEISNAFCFTNTRIKFLDENLEQKKNPLQGQVFCYHGADIDSFEREFCSYGLVLVKGNL